MMKLGLTARILLSAVIATTVAVGARHWETRSALNREADSAFALATQVASQAEGLAFAAREKGESDPLRWAANHLSQGNDPRIIQVSKVKLAEVSVDARSRVQAKEGRVELIRASLPERGEGLRVQIKLRPVRFMGAGSVLSSDLRLVFVFVGVFSILFALLSGFSGAFKTGLPALAGEWAGAWAGESRALLVRVGTHVREIIRGSQALVAAAANSRDAVATLRESLHQEILSVSSKRKSLRDLRDSTSKAEALALNLVLEAQQLGESGKRASEIAEELHRFFRQVRHLGSEGEALLTDLEAKLEPWVTDADIAFHAHEEVFRTAQGMDSHIRSARESLLSQAKLIQDVQKKIAG